jgi:UDP-3-O-[3-hydroxymyristoyl] glucosamine N-acyltransferase
MSYRLGDLAEQFDCQLHGDPDTLIATVCTLQAGKPDAISFLANTRYSRYLTSTTAAAVILRPQDAEKCPVPSLAHSNPYACYARIASVLSADSAGITDKIHPSAVIDDSAKLGKSVSVGPNSVIGKNVILGDACAIGPGVVIGDGVQIGEHGFLHSNITVYHDCRIGKHAILHAGVIIGADGFGIAQDNGEWVKVPQLGRVIIGDHVEIGANSCIDRGAIDDTVIEDGVKLDNLIQIGHNVRIGAHSALAGCVGVAGSAVIGKRCTLGARATVLGHLELVDDVHLTAESLATKSISEPGVYSSGTPLQPNRQWRRNFTRFGQLDEMAKRLNKLEKQINQE